MAAGKSFPFNGALKVIFMRRQPFVEVFREIMNPDGNERVGILIHLEFRKICGGSYCGHNIDRNYFLHIFDRLMILSICYWWYTNFFLML